MSPLWRVVRRFLGKPKGRHAMGAPPPSSVARSVEPLSLAASFEDVTAVDPVVLPGSGAPVEPDLGLVRLIFSDGTIASLPEGSPEELRARYLGQRVLEAAFALRSGRARPA